MSNWIIILPIVAFAAIILGGLGIRYLLSKPDLQRRLEGIRADAAMTMDERLKLPFADRVMLPMLDSIGARMKQFTKQAATDQLQRQLVQAGLYPRMTTSRFEGVRWLSAIGMLFVGAVYVPAAGYINPLIAGTGTTLPVVNPFDVDGLALFFGAFFVGYYLPILYIKRKVGERQGIIRRALPSSIDLISVGAEAGMGFDQVVNYVRRRTTGPLSDEFGATLNEIRLGKTRIEALNNLVYRTGLDDMKVFVGAIVQSFQLGTSIVETLRIQADSIRVKQRQRAQEQAMKAPVKMLVPLVFFIFPALLVVILGPAGIMILTSDMGR
ncbi:MAG: type II secretion system F family protein [Verrucomicrobia bacterium]|nr:type II secretion system F family protein [Verrucomicrobiota bacterium]